MWWCVVEECTCVVEESIVEGCVVKEYEVED